MGPWFTSPRRVWVLIGPFIGWRTADLAAAIDVGSVAAPALSLMLMGVVTGSASGLPRSQTRLSLSPNMWQLAQDASPLEEVRVAS